MTKLTKAEREELRKIIAEARDVCHCGQYVDEHTVSDNHAALAMDTQESDRLTAASLEAMPRLLADLDAAEAERDEIKTALGVMGATRERALDVAGSQDALEERIDSMSRERDVALKGWSAAEAARDAAAAQRDRAESELDAERKMRVEAEAASDRMAAERDALKAKLLAADCREVDSEDSPRRCTDDKPCGRHLLAAQCFDARQAWSQERTEVNALKAKLAAAESAHSELFLSGQVAELRGRLAALVKAADPFACDQGCDAVHHPVKDRHDQRDNCPVVARLRAAIAAARGGAQ